MRHIQHGYCVSETVRHILRTIDPVGGELCRRRRLRRRLYSNPGRNVLWRVDRYNKLKSYGLCVRGAIGGFSRHVIWLHVYTTNSDLVVIGGYFVDAVKFNKI